MYGVKVQAWTTPGQPTSVSVQGSPGPQGRPLSEQSACGEAAPQVQRP
ncbi:MAG TPA: hypothetical protein VH853_15955 [Polyangia bacterium]|nr:hypothetical protein [Polyangia bacterium]